MVMVGRIIVAIVIGAALGVAGSLIVWKPQQTEISRADATQGRRSMLDPSGMASHVAWAARETYGAHVEPEALCPNAVPAERGYQFHCEASFSGTLVPVLVEVTSPLGFYSIRSVDGIVWRGSS